MCFNVCKNNSPNTVYMSAKEQMNNQNQVTRSTKLQILKPGSLNKSDERSYQFAKISDMVDEFIVESKNDIPEDQTTSLPDEEYFSRDHSWEPSFEDDYSPYNSEAYGDPDGVDSDEEEGYFD